MLKDYCFGLALFLMTTSMATLDSRVAWTAPNTIAQKATGTRIAPSVEKLKAQHNVAVFISNPLKPEYSGIINSKPDLKDERRINMETPMQIISANALDYALIGFLFASMFTLTFSFWRYLRREYASPRRTKWRRG